MLQIKGKFHHATVSFTGEFPIDMLRYDRCYPRAQIDVDVIISSLNRITCRDEVKIVHLERFVETGSIRPWEIARWKSMGCDLKPDLGC
jgi:hypothetical protein